MNMSSYASQPQQSRPPPRLQNVNKSGLGNGAGTGWGGFGLPGSGGTFGGLGGAPGLGQARPGQLSGFAQVMGGGSGQGPIDMRYVPNLCRDEFACLGDCCLVRLLRLLCTFSGVQDDTSRLLSSLSLSTFTNTIIVNYNCIWHPCPTLHCTSHHYSRQCGRRRRRRVRRNS
jgi:hypothetical protein